MKTKKQSGYTIIELMIVIVIIGILGALSIPAYLSYTVKASVTDGIALVGNLKTAVAEHYNATGGDFPADRAALGLGPSTDTQGEYVSGIDVENGNLVVTYGNRAPTDISGATLAIRAYTDNDDNVSWFCGTADAPLGLTASGALVTPTDVASEYLPSNCRGSFGAVP